MNILKTKLRNKIKHKYLFRQTKQKKTTEIKQNGDKNTHRHIYRNIIKMQ